MDLFRVNCAIPKLPKSKAVRGKYCIVFPGEGNEFELSTKDTCTLISRRVICVPGHSVGSFMILQVKFPTALRKTKFLHYFFSLCIGQIEVAVPGRREFDFQSLPGDGEFNPHALGVGNLNCTLDFM